MKLTKKPGAFIGLGAVTIATAAAIAMVAMPAVAATQANGSDAGVYSYDPGTDALFPATQAYAYGDSLYGSPSKTNALADFQCGTDSTGIATFIAAPGNERTVSSWISRGVVSFGNATAKTVHQIDLSPYGIGSTQAAFRTAGSTWSVGFACMKNAIIGTGVFYYTAHVTSNAGDYTVDRPTEDAPVTPPQGSQAYTLHATTIAAADGVLSLVAPATSDVTFGTATLVNNLSTSTATLPTLTVHDARVVSHPGWTLTSTVAPFVNAADSTKTIANTQLGLAPVVGNTSAAGVTAGTTQVAGSAVYASTFAQAGNNAQVGDTVLGANLTFVAPASATAGTYNSTLTLTLTSK